MRFDEYQKLVEGWRDGCLMLGISMNILLFFSYWVGRLALGAITTTE